MVDAGLAFQVPAALERARLLEQFHIGWLEEPLSQDDMKGYSELCAASPVPIAAGEGEVTRWGFQDLIQRGGHILRPGGGVWGGLPTPRERSGLARAAGSRCVPHAFSPRVKLTEPSPRR